MRSVRGAVFADGNSLNEISKRTCELYRTLLVENSLNEDSLVNLIISVTADLTAINPCTALRKDGLAHGLPLFCVQEALFEGSPALCIRFLLTVNTDTDLKPVYLNGAAKLRPDLF